MYSIFIGLVFLLLTGCSRAWIDAGVCVDTSKLPDIDIAQKVVNGGNFIKYDSSKVTERCVKLNVGDKNLSYN